MPVFEHEKRYNHNHGAFKNHETVHGGPALKKVTLKNMAASVHQKLLNLSLERRENFQLLLTRYTLERFLYRLSKNPACGDFVLKGAFLFEIWKDVAYRATRDVDFLGYGSAALDRLRNIFVSICQQRVENDGLIFDSDSIVLETIREEQDHGGMRVRLSAYLGQARIRLQFDIGFGDVIIPDAEEVEFPVLLDMPAPRIKAYSRYSFVSEKFHTISYRGMANSRMKDYYDLYILARFFEFPGHLLAQAISMTFKRRNTPLPGEIPLGLSKAFVKESTKQRMWKAFLERIGENPRNLTLDTAVTTLQNFLVPPTSAVFNKKIFDLHWNPGGPWKTV